MLASGTPRARAAVADVLRMNLKSRTVCRVIATPPYCCWCGEPSDRADQVGAPLPCRPQSWGRHPVSGINILGQVIMSSGFHRPFLLFLQPPDFFRCRLQPPSLPCLVNGGSVLGRCLVKPFVLRPQSRSRTQKPANSVGALKCTAPLFMAVKIIAPSVPSRISRASCSRSYPLDIHTRSSWAAHPSTCSSRAPARAV